MRRPAFFPAIAAGLAASLLARSIAFSALAPTPKPKLAVMIVVDQFREPYLERYGKLFHGGFRRLLDDGRFYTNATHDHANTETAVGHSTLSTGVYPMRHGIVANDWKEKTGAGWTSVSNVGDSTVKIVGYPALPGVSPHYLLRTGLADWLTKADARSIVASVSAKDRGAVLPAAHAKGQVYWFEPKAGRFVTSTYYRDQYPTWADAFTSATMNGTYARDSVWDDRTPTDARSLASADSVAWENDGVHVSFPHRAADEARPGRFWDWFATTPMLDAATLDYAEAMVAALGMGKDEVPDLLNVSLSQTDRVGHAFGPLSREQLDNLLRLDAELGAFFDFLDRTVGKDRWVVGLSADHGSLLAPETLPQPGESTAGHRATAAERAQLKAIMDSATQHANDPRNAERVAGALEKLPFVAAAYLDTDLLRSQKDSFAVLERHSLFPGRAGDDFSPFGVEVRFAEGFINKATGTTHGTPYWYDRHVPIIFMGPGIAKGRDGSHVATVDFAPTLAHILGIAPDGPLDGKRLSIGR